MWIPLRAVTKVKRAVHRFDMQALGAEEDGHTDAQSGERPGARGSRELQAVGHAGRTCSIEREYKVSRKNDIGGGGKDTMDVSTLWSFSCRCGNAAAVGADSHCGLYTLAGPPLLGWLMRLAHKYYKKLSQQPEDQPVDSHAYQGRNFKGLVRAKRWIMHDITEREENDSG